MGGFSFYSNVTSLGLQNDTATPANVLATMPLNSVLFMSSSELTNPAWNFPNGRYTLEVINIIGGRTPITIYGKTFSESDYRMFLNSTDNLPTGEWTKILTNADMTQMLTIPVPAETTYTLSEAESSKLKNNRVVMIIAGDNKFILFAFKWSNTNYNKMYNTTGSYISVDANSNARLSITNNDTEYARTVYILSL